ncbi:hypothetical protein FRACYDRAFT_244121 [Fragilariopsis cylindrus CCMP1102]|uniref:J domain-containing protein n=1 Tax=Fragilariopsis cylindrus CCMP1102 TaxID=635003 RepID=A0A1E7F3T1_9STRA|nr:hypothetical protein FRACYDRAFT_244121 [Fragilariopsis cylindrus CCMP1102]|eukprot:OEU12848.1 hypothetical protein FRACYDRAFT_244121 [Fragilariopsis cylindrus CCMP1102]
MQRLQNFTATVQAAVVPCFRVGNVMNRRRNKNNNPISNNYGRLHNVQLLYSTTTTTIKNPFRVLGLPSFTSFSIVQKKFLKLAIKHHPDTKAVDNNDTGNTVTGTGTGTMDSSAPISVNDDFVRIRTAYEQIRNEHNRRQLRERSTTFTSTRTSQNYTATERNNNNNNNDTYNTTDYSDSSSFTFTSDEEENEFLDWFYDMSKVRITSMQRKEMVAVYWKQARLHEHYPGGQFWDFARRLVTFQEAFLQNREKNKSRNESKNTTTKTNKNKMKENISIRRKRHPRGR